MVVREGKSERAIDTGDRKAVSKKRVGRGRTRVGGS